MDGVVLSSKESLKVNKNSYLSKKLLQSIFKFKLDMRILPYLEKNKVKVKLIKDYFSFETSALPAYVNWISREYYPVK